MINEPILRNFTAYLRGEENDGADRGLKNLKKSEVLAGIPF